MKFGLPWRLPDVSTATFGNGKRFVMGAARELIKGAYGSFGISSAAREVVFR
jgi:hypothetical protein